MTYLISTTCHTRDVINSILGHKTVDLNSDVSEACYKSDSIAQRLSVLKQILLKAVEERDKLFLVKFICTHANVRVL